MSSEKKKNLERKITELYIRLRRRTTQKLSRKASISRRLEAAKAKLQQLQNQESSSASNSDLLDTQSTLSLD